MLFFNIHIDLIVGEWEDEIFNDFSIKTRKLEYIVALSNTFGSSKSCKTVLCERILKKVPSEMYIVDSDSLSSGVMYADCFKVNTRSCLTKCSVNSSKLLVHSTIVYMNKPNFIVKGK
jgi:hypothetical protein